MIRIIGDALLAVLVIAVYATLCYLAERLIERIARARSERRKAHPAPENTFATGRLWRPAGTVPKGHYYCAMCGEPEAPKPRTLCPACMSYWGMEDGERECVLRDYELQMEEAQQ